MPIGSSAIAVQDAQASFAVGSRLLKLDGGLLGGLLGSGLSLSVMDYDALIKARVDLFDFSKRLATRLSLTAATYDDVLKADARLGDILAAVVDASRDNDTRSGAATAALGRIAAASVSNLPVELSSLISFGPVGEKPLSGPKPLAASLTALDIVSAIAQIANGNRQIDLGLNLNLPGIAAVSLKLGIGERPVGTSLVRVGRTGASVYTAQTRLLLTVDLELRVEALGLGLELPGLDGLVSGVVANAATPLDQILNAVLGTLGIGLGQADSWVSGVRCGGAILVR